MLLVEELTLPNGKKVNISLEAGTSYILKGRNGSGKSLLLKSLAYLLPTKFKTFKYRNSDITSLRPESYRSLVLYSPSSPSMAVEGTTEDYLWAPLKLGLYKGFTPRFNPLPHLERWNLSGKKLAQLSSGERQLLSFLRTISYKAEILLLDEPMANLDQTRTKEVEELLVDWQKRTGGSFVLVSHLEHPGLQATTLDFSEICLTANEQ